MNLKLQDCRHQSMPVNSYPPQEVHSFSHMGHHSLVRCFHPKRRLKLQGVSSMEDYLRSSGSKTTTTLPEIRMGYPTQGTQPILMNLSQYSAGTTLRISSRHLSASETILLHLKRVPLGLRTFLKIKMMREIFQKTHQLFQRIKVCQGRPNSSTRQCQ